MDRWEKVRDGAPFKNRWVGCGGSGAEGVPAFTGKRDGTHISMEGGSSAARSLTGRLNTGRKGETEEKPEVNWEGMAGEEEPWTESTQKPG